MSRVLMPHEPGFVAKGGYFEASKFGFIGVPNPRISNQKSHVIFSCLDYPGDTRLMPGKGPRWPDKPEHWTEVGDGEIAVVFDLDKPLGQQLEYLKETLSEYQIRRHGKVIQKRHQQKKWLMYLRVLDAHECGASLTEIAEILDFTARTPQTARDVLRQAEALCFNL